ncbi:MAG: amidohydrolase family protein [Saprospiraceae bacterium]
MKFCYSFLLVLFLSVMSFGQTTTSYILKAKYIFNGEQFITNKAIVVKNNIISDIIPLSKISNIQNATILDYPNHTLMPGMIEGHSHILLHPYNETSWTDQVLKESIAERSIRAGNHVKASLMAGFTTMRDLGAEGAGYADVGIRQSIEKGVISGPRMLVAGPAIVVTGSYGPKGFADHVKVPLGANEADGIDGLTKEVRTQIGNGVDVIKVYADYRWGPFGQAMPTFTIDELKLIVKVSSSSGRQVVAHAATAEGMRRATMAGVSTIEHGDAGTAEVFKLMKEKNVALCPTLAAGDAILQYRGWKKGTDPEPERIRNKKNTFALALQSGVKILAGGDVGVFSHGDNVKELEMMVDYGMNEKAVLENITAGNAVILGLNDRLGRIQKGLLADIIAVKGNPIDNISHLRKVEFVMKDGIIYKK